MSKLEPIWSNLPLHFRQNLVGKLNYKDRFSLRKCSKQDRRTVDISKLYLHDVAIQICSDYTIFSYSDDGATVILVKYSKSSSSEHLTIEVTESPKVFIPGKNQKIISKTSRILKNVHGEDDIDFAIRDFLTTTIRKLHVENLIINDVIIRDLHLAASPERVSQFRSQFVKSLSLLKTSIDVRCLKLVWHSAQDDVLWILSHFTPGTLKTIWFSDRHATWQMDKVAECEHWRRAEDIQLEVKTDLPIENLLHVTHLQAHVADLAAEHVWTVIQAFLRKRTAGASFHFSYQDTSPDLQRILDQFNVTPQNLPIQPQTQLRTILSRRFLFTQRFPIPAERLVLVVMIAEKEVLGTVCHVDSVNVEAKVERGLLR